MFSLMFDSLCVILVLACDDGILPEALSSWPILLGDLHRSFFVVLVVLVVFESDVLYSVRQAPLYRSFLSLNSVLATSESFGLRLILFLFSLADGSVALSRGRLSKIEEE